MARSVETVGFAVTVGALSVLVGGCGSSPGNHVAQLGTGTTTTTTATQGSTSPRSFTTQVDAYARCTRSHGVTDFPDLRRHGVPNWPDPQDRSATDSRPMFDITAVGLNGNSAQLRAKAGQCASVLHMGGLPAAG